MENENNFKKLIMSIIETLEKCDDNEYKKHKLFEFLSNEENLQYFENAEDFNVMIFLKFENIVELIIKELYKTNSNIITDIYLNYSIYDNILSNIIKDAYGVTYSIDKARFLLNHFIQYKLTNKLPVFNKDSWNTIIGNEVEWMEFINSIYLLKYGNYVEYPYRLNLLIHKLNLRK